VNMPPIPLGRVDAHFWLTQGMARTLGINLSEAMAEGRLDADDYAEMVTRCRGAACCARCIAWMGQQGAGASAAPDFCVNADRLNALRS